MSSQQRSSGKVGICLFLLLCAGASAWYFTRGEVSKSSSEVVRQDTEVSTSAESVTPSRIQPEESGLLVAAPLHEGPRPREVGPEEAVMARVEQALQSEGNASPSGPTVSGALTERAPLPDEDAEDPVVTSGFVSDLARWLTSSYKPSAREGVSGRTSVTLARANARYSSSATLRSVESDTLKGRASILRHVYTPGMLEVLSRMYMADFTEELEKAAGARRGGRELQAAQVADMFKVYADFLRRVASALEAASRTDLRSLVGTVQKAADSEARASEAFSRAYTAHADAREEGRTADMAVQSAHMVRSAREASEFDAREEQARAALALALRTSAVGPTLSDSDLIFLGEWLVRHKAEPEASVAAARVCRKAAESLEKRAVGIMAVPEKAPEMLSEELPVFTPAPVPAAPVNVPVPEPVSAASVPIPAPLPSAPALPIEQ